MINLEDTINSLILELDIAGTPEEVNEAKESLKEKFYSVVQNTLLDNLTPEQQKDFLEILKKESDEKKLSIEIEKLAAAVPGLLGQITDALDRELKIIRALFGKKE